MSIYEIGFLGGDLPDERERLQLTLSEMVADYSLDIGTDVIIRSADDLEERDRHAAFAAVYFGHPDKPDKDVTKTVILDSVPIIPTLGRDESFSAVIPDFLQVFNGLQRRDDDPDMRHLASAVLECLGLLRRQRQVFVSYRRNESRAAAVQLHDLLSSRGYDVFLDTHDIRPGDPFQDVLWHRLCDSDVVVMLDTPTYFESKWTKQEIGRARAKEIHVLRVVWPDHRPSRFTDLAETIYLDPHELEGVDGPIIEKTANDIVTAVEKLRSRSIASRYMSITGKLRAEVLKIDGVVEGVGAHRAVAIKLEDGQRVWAYPIVGVPTALTLNDVAERARDAQQRGTPVLIYDHIGIREAWAAHLKWLDENISSVRAMKVSQAGWDLAAWES
ncbi:hypothetical protein GGI64_004132 [Rhizobium leguminosarum]|uniref:TIR domain-containing protein n=1 Tax=Rhizobium leguminosarum TaxID=384 RepID=A0A7Z0E1G3_RHILE|nr:toll/interleukin-1 receptor domain-containing protein [Rhizobium leguminosarum]NYJ13051.1 hypothetical protein [Rhizobium leguminosarum]